MARSPTGEAPYISVVVVCFNMRREAPRTLYSLSRAYQKGIETLDYEVIVVDNGSTEPLDEDMVTSFGPEFSYLFWKTDSCSPVAALNAVARRASGRYLMLCIDGARILSPGVLRLSWLGTRIAESPVITPPALHLGEKIQKLAMQEGYDQQAEDRLLASRDWRADGYALYEISCLANSSAKGWFFPISESSCLTLSHSLFDMLGGYDEEFVMPGGGLASLDIYKRACEFPGSTLVMLLGEGTFHQFHGGAATNSPPDNHPGSRFREEYRQIRGREYERPQTEPVYLGTIPAQARWLMKQSLSN